MQEAYVDRARFGRPLSLRTPSDHAPSSAQISMGPAIAVPCG
jgi:hypothetical protein